MATVPSSNIRIPLNRFVEPSTGRPTQEWLLWLLNPQVLSQTIQYTIINGGVINNTTIGLTTPAAGKFTDLTALNGIGGGDILNDLDLPKTVTREQIEKLQAEMVNMPQAELVTEHYFVPGMYCRRVFRSAGTLIVGKIHKQPHFFLCAAGEIIAWTENGMKRLQAGDVVECKAGTKRVTLATQDSVGITIHKTDKTDLDEMEKELIEPDDLALFDSQNRLISQTLGEIK